MKRKTWTNLLGSFCLLIGFMMCFTSCDNSGSGVSGNAPQSVAGKTFKIINAQGEHVWTIEFSSNTSASIHRLFEHTSSSPTYGKYEKTGPDSATLQLGSSEGNYTQNWALIFISPNEGTVNTQGMTFTLF